MKANELMIGDWVKVTDDDTDDSFIGQVKAVDDLGNVNIPEGEDVAYPYSIDCLEPIPLTSEILEKNGWVSKRDGSGDFIYMRENTPGYGSNDMTVTKNIIGNFQMIHGSFNGISVHYVHELQHALRLCGIEKEIIL